MSDPHSLWLLSGSQLPVGSSGSHSIDPPAGMHFSWCVWGGGQLMDLAQPGVINGEGHGPR